MPRTVSDLRTEIRYEANLTDKDLPDADLLRLINKYYQELVTDVVRVNEDRFYEIATSDLVANQQEYTLPRKVLADSSTTEAIKVKRVELNYTGADPTTAKHIDVNEIEDSTDQETVNNNFDQNEPFFDMVEQSIFIFPIPTTDIVGGFLLHYIERPDDLVADSDAPHAGLPVGYHYLIVEGTLKDIGRRFRKTDLEDRARAGYDRGRAEMVTELEVSALNEDLAFRALNDYEA